MSAPYRVGAWQVEPRQRRIRNGGDWQRLEPKSMAVLDALVAANGEPVSREALIEAVWPGRVVTDDAVNRQVAKLRKALGDDPRTPRYIETIPKTGFRLLVAAAPAAQQDRQPTAVWRGWPLLGSALAVAALLGLGLRSATPEPTTLRQITATPGLEIQPSPSPSGRAVAYARRGADGWDLWVYDLDSGASDALVTDPGHDYYPAWSPSGDRIAYVHVEPGLCEIRLVTLYRQGSTRLTGCTEAQDGGGLGWSPLGDQLYFSDRIAGTPEAPFAVRRLDLASGVVAGVLDPMPGSVGDTTPRVAADGRLAFLRVRTLGVEDVFVQASGAAPQRSTFDDGKIHGIAWQDDRLVLASNRWGGVFGLWRLEPDGALTRLASPPGADGPGAAGSLLAFEHWQSQVDLWAAPLNGDPEAAVLDSTRWDWAPAVSPDGRQLAWISDRTGAAELWLAAADGSNPRQLTRFEGPYTQRPVWMPDGQGIVVAAPIDGQFDLFAVSVASGATRRLTHSARDEFAPVFAPDGRLLFRRELPSGPTLVAEDGETVLAGVSRAEFAPDGTLWFARHAEPGLWRLAAGSPERVVADLETVDWQNWWVDAEGVFFIERPVPDAPRLVRFDPATGARHGVRELPRLLYKSGLTRLGDSVVYARDVRYESDLFLLGG